MRAPAGSGRAYFCVAFAVALESEDDLLATSFFLPVRTLGVVCFVFNGKRAAVTLGVFPPFIFTAGEADDELGAWLFLMHVSDAAACSSDMGGVFASAGSFCL